MKLKKIKKLENIEELQEGAILAKLPYSYNFCLRRVIKFDKNKIFFESIVWKSGLEYSFSIDCVDSFEKFNMSEHLYILQSIPDLVEIDRVPLYMQRNAYLILANRSDEAGDGISCMPYAFTNKDMSFRKDIVKIGEIDKLVKKYVWDLNVRMWV